MLLKLCFMHGLYLDQYIYHLGLDFDFDFWVLNSCRLHASMEDNLDLGRSHSHRCHRYNALALCLSLATFRVFWVFEETSMLIYCKVFA